MKLYYAHPQSWYGTPEEQADLDAIRKHFPNCEIVNPADLTCTDMADFLHWVQGCDALVYRPFKNFGIGAGVAREILEAKVWGKPVYSLYYAWTGATKKTKGIPYVDIEKRASRTIGPIMTIDETRKRLKAKEL